MRHHAAFIYGSAILSVLVMFTAIPAVAQDRDRIYQEATHALYSLDFGEAEAGFRKLTEIEPANASNWNNVASTLWFKIVAAQEKLDIQSFSGESIGTEDSKNVVTPAAETELRRLLDTAIAKADARLAKNSKDVLAHYDKGMSKGVLAAFEAVVKKKYLAAYSNAREAKKLHEQVLKLDPSFRDARLTIGLYDYAAGSIPGWLRLFLGMAPWGGGGDKKDGLNAIVDVASNGKRVASDAKMFLVIIYNREKQYEKSVDLVTRLHAMYPRNYLLELSKGIITSRMLKWDRAIEIYADVLKKVESRTNGYERFEAPKVLRLMAQANIDKSDVPTALALYERILADKRSTSSDRANAHFSLGTWSDVASKRDVAIAHYKAVLTLDCSPALKERAQKYIKKPYP